MTLQIFWFCLIAVLWSGIIGVSLYVVPILGILLVLPAKAISNISGFIDAITTIHGLGYRGS